ncbi:hypothetical protein CHINAEXTREME_03470 [Halobiforma lacisalsi AJ5]|uniref:Uncharacterized protein n=1 Tax=Natronobacterium lacisalsi AJ5 TaxID=358396 RepID=M0LM63_NATLA|nr:hypothetical protein [Halobiforma lacisalsi]APW96885.1 hypothetical protein CHINAEXTREME_03470 [Halobiforma lacisalsi AJ5]EMA34591.1 hypothetical protein C445_06705 [Halobiforma lacisalsi AJ5]
MNPQLRRIIREELLRGIAWIGLGIVGWPLVISAVAWLDATALTVFGLPVLTWATLTVGMIGLRLITGSDLQVRTKAGLDIVLLEGILVTGFLVVYLVAVAGWSLLPTVGGYLAITVLYVLYYWQVVLPQIEVRFEG